MMKFFKTFVFLSVLFLPAMTFALPANAQGFLQDLNSQLKSAAEGDGAGFDSAPDPRAVIAYRIKMAYGALGIAFVGYMVYGGAKLLLSQGNPDAIETAKGSIRTSIIGLFILLAAWSITTFAVKLITGDVKHRGSYIEIKEDQNPNPDPLNAGTSPNAFSPLPCDASGDCGVYSN